MVDLPMACNNVIILIQKKRYHVHVIVTNVHNFLDRFLTQSPHQDSIDFPLVRNRGIKRDNILIFEPGIYDSGHPGFSLHSPQIILAVTDICSFPTTGKTDSVLINKANNIKHLAFFHFFKQITIYRQWFFSICIYRYQSYNILSFA